MSDPRRSAWALRPRDLPSPRAVAAVPRFAELKDNAAYRLMVYRSRTRPHSPVSWPRVFLGLFTAAMIMGNGGAQLLQSFLPRSMVFFGLYLMMGLMLLAGAGILGVRYFNRSGAAGSRAKLLAPPLAAFEIADLSQCGLHPAEVTLGYWGYRTRFAKLGVQLLVLSVILAGVGTLFAASAALTVGMRAAESGGWFVFYAAIASGIGPYIYRRAIAEAPPFLVLPAVVRDLHIARWSLEISPSADRGMPTGIMLAYLTSAYYCGSSIAAIALSRFSPEFVHTIGPLEILAAGGVAALAGHLRGNHLRANRRKHLDVLFQDFAFIMGAAVVATHEPVLPRAND